MCVLSPLLFNLHINEISVSLEQDKGNPFILPDGTKLSTLLNADDLVILSHTQTGLQNALNILNDFCNEWKLTVNLKKTKVVVFQKKSKKEHNYQFFLDKNSIDIVSDYTYLGIKLTSNGKFSDGIKVLREKSKFAMGAF